jgi:hypothetical protein
MRRSTVVILLLFLITAGAYFYLKNRNQPAESADIAITLEPTIEVSYLFPAEDGVPNGIRLEAKAGEVVALERDADSAWVIKQPIEAAADQGASEAAASQVTTIRITDFLPDLDPQVVGLDNPDYTLIVEFSSGVERIADIGVLTPTESGYYVSRNGEIAIVGRSGIDALLGLLTNPPYVETPTPSPVPPTATNTPLPSSTPEAVTPTDASATPTP